MKNIIDSESSKNHNIEPYHFKVLGGVSGAHEAEESAAAKEVAPKVVQSEPAKPIQNEPVVQIDEQQNRFIEELLKKSDELSSNIIKLQMQIEKQEDDFNSRLQNELQRESQSSFEKGYQKAKEELEAQVVEVKNKFLNSINILEVEAKNGNEFTGLRKRKSNIAVHNMVKDKLKVGCIP